MRTSAFVPAENNRLAPVRQAKTQPGFIDNRPSTAAQRKLMDIADNSPRTMQQKAFMGGIGAHPPMNVVQGKRSVDSNAPVVQRNGPSYIPDDDGPNAGIAQAPATAGVVSFDNVADTFYAGLASANVNQIAIAGGIDTYQNDDPAGGDDVVRTGDINPVIGQIDHIVPRSLGGGTSFINAQLVDAPTNNNKGDTYPCPISGLDGTRVFLGTAKWSMPAGTILETDAAAQRIQVLDDARVPKNLGVTLYDTAAAAHGTLINAGLHTSAANYYIPENDDDLTWLAYDEASDNGLAPAAGGPL